MSVKWITLLLGGVVTATPNARAFADNLEISGFARVVGGVIDTDKAEFEGYDERFSISEQSLLAAQGDLAVTDNLSLSMQLLAHSSEDRDSGVEWLYLTYDPTAAWTFKLGKLRTPFFLYSDVIDVGFAYPWITAPEPVYGGFLFSNYLGGTATYRFQYNQAHFSVEAYYGSYDGTFDRAGEETNIEVDEIKGIIFSAQKGRLSARVSAIVSSDFYADIPGFDEFADLLDGYGYNDNAALFRFDSDATAYQASLQYDALDYFAYAEVINIQSDLISVPEVNAFYITLGRNINDYQLFATFASSTSRNDIPENHIPKGTNPQLNSLSFAYDEITSNLPLYDLNSLSLGARWNFRYNLSAKAEITWLKGEPGQNSFYSQINDDKFNRQAFLSQVALEWLF
ncbi:hypothetical protein [Aestuariibacter sp. A3R04]|uniref:hypothetical protein n=1 Tax=Aestuariibacter sp. A3R04 TaxID=2841571 RepID=UPI001C09CB7C|nr:hypothetical protein [Aestuariibacter sp. A3R04]MBU3021675.1 hypothetical protein [Aestuariibacter sp. A3R04]